MKFLVLAPVFSAKMKQTKEYLNVKTLEKPDKIVGSKLKKIQKKPLLNLKKYFFESIFIFFG
jgi:hypothetical protein